MGVLSVDLAGPIKGAADGSRYFLLGAYVAEANQEEPVEPAAVEPPARPVVVAALWTWIRRTTEQGPPKLAARSRKTFNMDTGELLDEIVDFQAAPRHRIYGYIPGGIVANLRTELQYEADGSVSTGRGSPTRCLRRHLAS